MTNEVSLSSSSPTAAVELGEYEPDSRITWVVTAEQGKRIHLKITSIDVKI